MYDGLHYAKMRLQETITRYGEEPVYVHRVYEGGRGKLFVQVSKLNDMDNHFELRVDQLNLERFHVGYVNCARRAEYCASMPIREDWRQGLRSQNTRSHSGKGIMDIRWDATYDAVMNKYPSFNDAIRVVQEAGPNSCAFHREFAVTRDGALEHKGRVVGKVDFKTGKVVLANNRGYLREKLGSATK